MAGVKPRDVTDALLSVGVRQGNTLLVHSDAIIAAQFPSLSAEQRLQNLIQAIEAAIGKSGTLVIPTFSYSFTRGEPFDVQNTPSTVGLLTEYFRKLPGVYRSADPIFSFAFRGPLAKELSSIPIRECFGPKSAFSALHDLNAEIVDLGCSMTRGGTFVHYVETMHGVNYRYGKTFSGTVIMPDRQSYECSVVYNVRDLSRKSEADFRRLQNQLSGEKKLRTADVGRSRILAVRAKDLFDTAWKMLDEDPVSLIAEGAGE